MNRFLTVTMALAAAVLAGGAAEAATTIDFDEFKHGAVTKLYSGPIVSKDFSFTADVANTGLAFWGSITPSNADPDGAALLNWNAKAVTVRRSDGDFFSLHSLDIADTYNLGTSSELLFTFFDGVKATTQTATLDRLKGLQTFAFDEDRLQWFSYAYVGSQSVQIDNVVVDVPVNAAVPEPATWAMMIMGLGGMGAVLRRRRWALAAAATT